MAGAGVCVYFFMATHNTPLARSGNNHSATLLALAAGAFCCGAIPQSGWQRLGRAQLDGLGPCAAVLGQRPMPAYASLRYRCGAFGSPADGARNPGEIRRCGFLRTPMQGAPWDAIRRDAMRQDGAGWDAVRCDGMRCDGMRCDGMQCM